MDFDNYKLHDVVIFRLLKLTSCAAGIVTTKTENLMTIRAISPKEYIEIDSTTFIKKDEVWSVANDMFVKDGDFHVSNMTQVLEELTSW